MNRKQAKIDVLSLKAYCDAYLKLDPSVKSGIVWKAIPPNVARAKIGSMAGHIKDDKLYWQSIMIWGRPIPSHYLVLALGEIKGWLEFLIEKRMNPHSLEPYIEFINGIENNNRLDNFKILWETPKKLYLINHFKDQKCNVSLDRDSYQWQAVIPVHDEAIFLGLYPSRELALDVYNYAIKVHKTGASEDAIRKAVRIYEKEIIL